MRIKTSAKASCIGVQHKDRTTSLKVKTGLKAGKVTMQDILVSG